MITIRPDYRQFIADNIPLILAAVLVSCLTPVGIYVARAGIEIPMSQYLIYLRVLVAVVGFLLWLSLFFMYLSLMSWSWQIGSDTIRTQNGIFSKRVNFIELYRVVDYSESQTFAQRCLGIKTVEIISTDRTEPSLLIVGVPSRMNLIEHIRNKVETCKNEKKVFEVANNNIF